MHSSHQWFNEFLEWGEEKEEQKKGRERRKEKKGGDRSRKKGGWEEEGKREERISYQVQEGMPFLVLKHYWSLDFHLSRYAKIYWKKSSNKKQ